MANILKSDPAATGTSRARIHLARLRCHRVIHQVLQHRVAVVFALQTHQPYSPHRSRENLPHFVQSCPRSRPALNRLRVARISCSLPPHTPYSTTLSCSPKPPQIQMRHPRTRRFVIVSIRAWRLPCSARGLLGKPLTKLWYKYTTKSRLATRRLWGRDRVISHWPGSQTFFGCERCAAFPNCR